MIKNTFNRTLGIAAALALLVAASPVAAQATHAPHARSTGPHTTSVPAPRAHAAPSSDVADGVVNIATASAEQLQLLPGIGPSKAQAILTYRTAHPFQRVEDILRVRGIGRATFRRLRSMITVSGATTMTTDVHAGRAHAPATADADTHPAATD